MPCHTPVPMVPTVTSADAVVRALRVVSVALLVAVMLAAVPAVFWFSVGKFPATAAAIEVPLP